MEFVELVQEILESKTLTRSLETQLHQLLWSKPFDSQEQAALEKLTQALLNRTVRFVR